jgi:NCS1 family nucleobase:cation symporter-1
VSLRDLYDPNGRYRYTGGVNWVAVAALIIAVAPCGPGFLHTVKLVKYVPPIWDTIYTYAWFVTFALAFTVYGVLMMLSTSVERDRTA